MKLNHGQLTTAGVLGLLAAVLVGAGEVALHKEGHMSLCVALLLRERQSDILQVY